MAYSNHNHLTRVKEIQDIYLKFRDTGISGEYIYQKYIKPVYHISRGTFYRYLSINARKKLREFD